MECTHCGSTYDVIDFFIGEEKMVLCSDCRFKLLSKKGSVGRPSMGDTKKVSLTLSDDDWEWFDEQSKGNRSKFLRYLINQEQSSESRWSNDAARGYVIAALEKLKYDTEDIQQVVNMLYGKFDMISVDEAKSIYLESDY